MSDFTSTVTFNNPALFIHDSNKVNINGTANLKLQDNPGQDFIEEFLNDTGFTYNPLKAEFPGDRVQQKDTRNGALFGANYSVNQNASWSTGSDVGTLYGGAAITSEQLDLSGGVKSYVKYTSTDNLGIIQGTIKFKITPQYSGSPPAYYWFLCDVNTVGIANEFSLFQTTAGNLCLTARDSTGSIVINTVSFGNWGQTASQDYEFALCFYIAPGGSEIRLFIDGQQKGSTITTGYTRNDHGRLFFGCEWSESTNADFLIDDIVLFDTVQHTTNYTPGYTINDTIYVETSVILPEMEWTGPGTLVSFDSLAVTYSGTPKILLEIGRSGDKLYWNGSGWVVSDETYNQATDPITFDTNCGSLNVIGEIYGQFTIVFPDSNTQSYVSELTASLTAQIYPTDNPTVEIITAVGIEALTNWLIDILLTGNDQVPIILKKNNDWYYHDGNAWVISDQTYPQSNTSAEILANISTFTTDGVYFKWRMFLHSDDGSTTPEVTSITYEYDFWGGQDSLNYCQVYGTYQRPDGNQTENKLTVRFKPNAEEIEISTQLAGDKFDIEIDDNNYWELFLVPSINLDGHYVFDFGQGIAKARDVVDAESAAFNSLPVA